MRKPALTATAIALVVGDVRARHRHGVIRDRQAGGPARHGRHRHDWNDARVVLPPTRATRQDLIVGAIEELRPGGSTNLETGLRLGYGLGTA